MRVFRYKMCVLCVIVVYHTQYRHVSQLMLPTAAADVVRSTIPPSPSPSPGSLLQIHTASQTGRNQLSPIPPPPDPASFKQKRQWILPESLWPSMEQTILHHAGLFTTSQWKEIEKKKLIDRWHLIFWLTSTTTGGGGLGYTLASI